MAMKFFKIYKYSHNQRKNRKLKNTEKFYKIFQQKLTKYQRLNMCFSIYKQ